MTFLLVAAGIALLAFAVLDIVWTTLASGSGAGPLTRRVGEGLWRMALAVHHRRRSHALLTVTGVVVVLAVLTTWIALALTGWSLIFFAADGAVRVTDTGEAAGTVERLYFVGFTVFTLGLGDMRPGAGTWQLATAIASGTGLVFVTLALTFLVPVAGAASQRRQLATHIHALGDSPQAIVTNAWTGSGFGYLNDHFVSLTSMVLEARQAHLTYPVLHYLHTADRSSAAPVGIADLSGALHLLGEDVRADHRPDPAVLHGLNAAVAAFLDVRSGFREGAVRAIDPPDPAALREAGIPLLDEHVVGDGRPDADRRRKRLARLLIEDGWEPSEILGRGASGSDTA